MAEQSNSELAIQTLADRCRAAENDSDSLREIRRAAKRGQISTIQNGKGQPVAAVVPVAQYRYFQELAEAVNGARRDQTATIAGSDGDLAMIVPAPDYRAMASAESTLAQVQAALEHNGRAALTLYDAAGRSVGTLVAGDLPSQPQIFVSSPAVTVNVPEQPAPIINLLQAPMLTRIQRGADGEILSTVQEPVK